MTAFEEQVTRVLRRRLDAHSLEYDTWIMSVISPQHASYCAVTLKQHPITVIKIVGEFADSDLALAGQIDSKIVSIIKGRTA